MNRATWLLLISMAGFTACQSKAAEPESRVQTKPRATGDPLEGRFSLAQATEGLGGEGKLMARIETDQGTLDCELFADRAPVTVANFVGLARGIRPYKGPGGEWVKQPAYDGTLFHRVVKGFMIQGGDWRKNGKGDAGYTIRDEIWEGAKHDRRGQLCMANKGPNTNSMQFFITDGPAKHLDGGYTIFGQCGPDEVIERLASVPTQGETAINPSVMRRIVIDRRAAPSTGEQPSAAAASAERPGLPVPKE